MINQTSKCSTSIGLCRPTACVNKNEIELVGTAIKISYTKLQDITQNFGGSVDSSCTTDIFDSGTQHAYPTKWITEIQ